MTHTMRTLFAASVVTLGISAAWGADAPATPGGVLVLSTRGDNTVHFIDASSGKSQASIEIGVGLHEIAASPDGSLAVGSCYGSGPYHQTPDQRLVVIDLAKREKAREIDLGEHVRPNDIVFLPDNRRLVCTSEVKAALLVVDAVEGKIEKEIALPQQAGHMCAVSPDHTRVYVAHAHSGGVTLVDLEKGQAVEHGAAAIGAEGIAVTPDGTAVWVACNRAGSIALLDAGTLETKLTIQSPGFPFRLRMAGKERAVVTHPQSGELKIFNLAGEPEGVVALKNGESSKAPTTVATSGCGRFAFVVCAQSAEVAAVDLTSRSVVWTVATGPTPDGMCWIPAS